MIQFKRRYLAINATPEEQRVPYSSFKRHGCYSNSPKKAEVNTRSNNSSAKRSLSVDFNIKTQNTNISGDLSLDCFVLNKSNVKGKRCKRCTCLINSRGLRNVYFITSECVVLLTAHILNIIFGITSCKRSINRTLINTVKSIT